MTEKIIFSTLASSYLADEIADISWIERWQKSSLQIHIQDRSKLSQINLLLI